MMRSDTSSVLARRTAIASDGSTATIALAPAFARMRTYRPEPAPISATRFDSMSAVDRKGAKMSLKSCADPKNPSASR
jgi:hypothetical protein